MGVYNSNHTVPPPSKKNFKSNFSIKAPQSYKKTFQIDILTPEHIGRKPFTKTPQKNDCHQRDIQKMFTAVLNQKSKIIIKQNITKHNTVGIDYDCITFQKKKKLIYQFILSFTKFKMLND